LEVALEFKHVQIADLPDLPRTEFQQHPKLAEIITHEPLVIWVYIYTFWKDNKIVYHFCIVRFSWFCTKFS
jgi:hypothetical protein